MRVTPEILDKQWSSIRYTDGGFLQINACHLLEWHIGYQSISQRTLLLVSDMEISSIESSKSIAVNRRKRETDGRWTLSFELVRNEQQGVFSILCCDIIEHSCSATSKAEALQLVISRYRQWSKLLEIQHGGLLDEKSRKGLLSELLFLEQRLSSANYALPAVQGWLGPDGADQDFIYPDGWYEIKSIGASASSVTISSLEQLNCATVGELVVNRIDKTAPDKVGAISLNDVVRRISASLIGSADALDLFRTKLGHYGYIDLPEYSEQKYYWSGTQQYRVDASFPKLISNNVPVQVVALQYELDLPSLTDWLKE